MLKPFDCVHENIGVATLSDKGITFNMYRFALVEQMNHQNRVLTDTYKILRDICLKAKSQPLCDQHQLDFLNCVGVYLPNENVIFEDNWLPKSPLQREEIFRNCENKMNYTISDDFQNHQINEDTVEVLFCAEKEMGIADDLDVCYFAGRAVESFTNKENRLEGTKVIRDCYLDSIDVHEDLDYLYYYQCIFNSTVFGV